MHTLEELSARLEWIGATDCKQGLLSRVEMRALAALFPALVADAKRYHTIRAFACEKDEATRERMEIAMDGVDIPSGDEPPTPELFDAVYDKWVAAIAGARDADC